MIRRRYFILTYKLAFKILIKSALNMLLLLLLLAGGTYAAAHIWLQGQALEKLNVGVVIDGQDAITEMAAHLAASMDSVRTICEFHYIEDEAKAREMFGKGELQALIVLPEDFYNSVNNGSNVSPEILVSESGLSGGLLFQELLRAASSLLQTAEAGVYAVLADADACRVRLDTEKLDDVLVRRYLQQAFDRMDTFDGQVVSATGELDVFQYYFSAVFLTALLMLGLPFGRLYQDCGPAFEAKLESRGVGRASAMVVKVSAMAAVLWLVGTVLLFAGHFALGGDGPGGVPLRPGGMALFFLECAAIAAYFHIVYCLAGDGFQGTLFLLLLNAGLLTVTGVLIPQAYLPEIAGALGRAFPAHGWNAYQQAWMFADVSAAQIVRMAGNVLAHLAAGVVITWKR